MPTLHINALALYNGPIADHLTHHRNGLTLDLRNADPPFLGTLVTDAIAADNRDISETQPVHRWTIETKADIPSGTAIQIFFKTGSAYFSEIGWTDWQPADPTRQIIEQPAGNYLKLKYVLSTDEKSKTPALHSVTLHAETASPTSVTPLRISDCHNERLITSPFAFGYERRDCPIIQNFVATHGLHEIIRTRQNDLDRFTALNHKIAQLPNTRHDMWQGVYPWTLDQVLVEENGRTAVKGHCMSYASILISALTGLGYYARHWAIEGIRFMNHEIVEVWSDEHQKWIYLDPSLDQHYRHPETREPLSVLDMHRIVIDTFFRDDETLLMPMERQKERVQSIGGKNAPISCVDLGYHYGSRVEDYDWGWFHGYLAAGFMQLTLRNDFHSNPDPVFSYFGDGIDEDHGFPHWIDARTPPKTDRIKRFSGRERDFYWTLNQAAYRATRISDDTLDIELGHTQPFFARYVITIDEASHTQTDDRFHWTLHPGENTLTVAPENEWGDRGIESNLTLCK